MCILSLFRNNNAMKRNLSLLAMVFFLWGNITAINSTIILFFYHYFQISWQQAMLITVLFYIAPFISCLPCSVLIAHWGYRRVLQFSLLLSTAGCLLLAAAISMNTFYGSLPGMFIVATGVAAMQVVANPYLSLLSPADRRVSNLSLASAVNSLGTTLAPVFLALLLKLYPADPYLHQEPVSGLWFMLALASIALLIGSVIIRLPDVPRPPLAALRFSSLYQQPQPLLSIAAIFIYVGVEVAIATSLVQYLTLSAGWSPETAMSLVSLYWGGALVGRLLFGLFASNAHNAVVFRTATLLGVLLVALATGLNNTAGGWLLLLTGLGNSVMYPIIFGHTLSQYPQQANLLAAAMVMAGIGGAIIPWLQAVIIDNISLHLSFLLPMALYALLAVWGRIAFAKEKNGVAPDRYPLP